MLADDTQVSIPPVSKREEEGESDYFYRKFNLIRKLTTGKRAVLVIDDFCGEVDAEFRVLLNADWKVVAVTRRDMSGQNFDTLSLQSVSKREDLYQLFENYAGRKVSKQEYIYLDSIIEQLRGHTLALALLARQVANSCLGLKEAAAFAQQYGFSHIAPEKVDYIKDQAIYYETLANIITALFDVSRLCGAQKRVLKLLSLFQMPKLDIHIIQRLLALETKDALNTLKREGWITIEGKNISIHPVIRESICQWEWTREYKAAAFQVMEEIYRQTGPENQTVQYAQAYLEGCKKEGFLRNSAIYRKLLYQTVLKQPREREAYILANAGELLKEPEYLNTQEALTLFDLTAAIYGEKKDYNAAYEKIMEAKAYVRRHPGGCALGQYYFMLSGFYDDRLAGQYAGEPYGCKNLLEALNKAIFHMERVKEPQGRQLLAKYMLSKALVLLRSGLGEKREIKKLFRSVKKAVQDEKSGFPNYKQDCAKGDNGLWTEVITGYYMGMAWYYALVEPDFASAEAFIQKARKFTEKNHVSGLDFIDTILIPHANILAELQKYEMSMDVLKSGIQICENYRDVVPYARKKMELCGCLSELNDCVKDYAKGKLIVGRCRRKPENMLK